MSLEFGPIVRMPEETLLHVFSNLDMRSLSRCTEVSRDWYRLASDDELWKLLFPEIATPETGVRAYHRDHSVLTREALLQRVQAFADQIQFNQARLLTFQFPYNPEYKIDVGYIYAYGFTPGDGDTNTDRLLNSTDPKEKEVRLYMTSRPHSSPSEMSTNCNSCWGKAFYATAQVSAYPCHHPGFENSILANGILSIVSDRLKYLEGRSFRNRIFIAGAVAIAAISLGFYLTNQSESNVY